MINDGCHAVTVRSLAKNKNFIGFRSLSICRNPSVSRSKNQIKPSGFSIARALNLRPILADQYEPAFLRLREGWFTLFSMSLKFLSASLRKVPGAYGSIARTENWQNVSQLSTLTFLKLFDSVIGKFI